MATSLERLFVRARVSAARTRDQLGAVRAALADGGDSARRLAELDLATLGLAEAVDELLVRIAPLVPDLGASERFPTYAELRAERVARCSG